MGIHPTNKCRGLSALKGVKTNFAGVGKKGKGVE